VATRLTTTECTTIDSAQHALGRSNKAGCEGAADRLGYGRGCGYFRFTREEKSVTTSTEHRAPRMAPERAPTLHSHRMPLSPGRRLGTYQIIGPLGTGGMGEVYRARDLKLDRDVAVKVLPEDVASSPDRLARFQREARTVAKLNHPNIVILYSIEEEDGIPFLTMELVEGGTLAMLLNPGGLPFERVFAIAIALSDALIAAHERG